MVELNAAQRDAVETLAGPLLVLAGAGTGKTRVVTHRIAHLIRHGVAPERILAVTFTNKAAAEMQARAAALLGKRQRKRPEISTFHSLCVRILRRQITALGYPAGFAIYDRSDQEAAARGALREIRVDRETLRPSDLLYQISRWKTAAVRPEAAARSAQTDKEHLAAAAYRRYQQALRAAGAVDFDDLLLLTDELFTRFAAAARAEAGRFDHLLVDEYQDTNAIQYRIVRSLARGHRNLCVVGDDDQSIYGWRGAEVAHILRFQRDWPEAKVVRLEENYRSRGPILETANRLIAHNRVRHPKRLRASRQGGEPPRVLAFADQAAEADEVASEIYNLIHWRQIEPRDVAILVRTNEQPASLETALRRLKLPYVLVGGQSFFDRKEVRDVLAYLRLCAGRRDDVTLLRVINYPPRGIGAATVEGLIRQAVGSGRSVWDLLGDAEAISRLPAAARGGIARLRSLVGGAATRFAPGRLASAAEDLLAEIGYLETLEREYPDPLTRQARIDTVEGLVNALASFERQRARPALADFLDEAALYELDDGDDKDEQLQRNAIALLTLHSAKGLEYPHVYMVGMEDGILPHKRSLEMGDAAVEEERRLCYVGLTRAQDRLTLSFPLSRMKWGQSRPTLPSRFLFEIATGDDAVRLAEQRAHALRVLSEAQQRRPTGPSQRRGAARPGASRPAAVEAGGRAGDRGKRRLRG